MRKVQRNIQLIGRPSSRLLEDTARHTVGRLTASAKLIAKWSEDEPHKDGSAYSHNTGGPDLFLGQVEGVLDFTEERSDSKPNEKGNEEAPPLDDNKIMMSEHN